MSVSSSLDSAKEIGICVFVKDDKVAKDTISICFLAKLSVTCFKQNRTRKSD